LRILIISAWYAPYIHPRAHRWTCIANELAAQGHTLHVVTARRRNEPQEGTIGGVTVHRVGFDSLKALFFFITGEKKARGKAGVPVRPPSLLLRFAIGCYQFFWKNIYFPDDACVWYFPARKKLRQLMAQEQFDAMITVSLPFTGQMLGRYLKKHFPSVRWVSDIGDPFSFSDFPLNNHRLYDGLNRRLEQATLEEADASVVTIAHTHARYAAYFGEKAVRNMYIIPPLLHPVPIPAPPQLRPERPLKVGYFGAMYAPVRTPDAFLALLHDTFAHTPAYEQSLEVHFYGEIFPEFYAAMRSIPAILLHGLRPRAEVSAAMQQMDILLNIGNQTTFQLPSKAVEYLATGKPIVNLCYTEPDPFTDFLGDHPGVLHLSVRNGRVTPAAFQAWLTWLGNVPPALSSEVVAQRVAPFRVENIAKKYLSVIEKQF
jgi:hypothetical protein